MVISLHDEIKQITLVVKPNSFIRMASDATNANYL